MTATSGFAATFTTDQAAFDAATIGLTFQSENFDGFNLTSQTNVDFGPFTATGPDFDVKPSSSFCVAAACITDIDNVITFTFDQAINALEFDLKSARSETFTLDGNPLAIGPSLSLVFIGIYDFSTPFTTLNIVSNGIFPQDLFDIDNLSFARGQPVPAVPLPAAFWLFGTALVGLVGFGKRKKAA
jgi:hypothetical protein